MALCVVNVYQTNRRRSEASRFLRDIVNNPTKKKTNPNIQKFPGALNAMVIQKIENPVKKTPISISGKSRA